MIKVAICSVFILKRCKSSTWVLQLYNSRFHMAVVHTLLTQEVSSSHNFLKSSTKASTCHNNIYHSSNLLSSMKCTSELSVWQSTCWLTCLQPSITGTMHSGSVAWVDSSISTVRNLNLDRRGSPAPTQVVQITSACWRKQASVLT